MNLDLELRQSIQKAVSVLYNQAAEQLQLQPTNAEFEGSHTLVCFPLTRISKLKPEETGAAIGNYLVAHSGIIARFNVVKGFLNLVVSDKTWANVFAAIYANKSYGSLPATGKEIMVEYSSPNTNKPLHLGHLRNNFLGYSVAEMYKAIGYTVHKVQIINDRGIHICKSMAAWKLYGNGETPQSSGLKGDKLVGKYYVEFDKNFKTQVKELQENGVTEADAEKQAPIMKLAVDMLQKWEAKDAETVQLWKTMNGWVYNGFDVTYKRMGVDFEKLYYESDTYLLGKEEVLKGLEKGIFFKKDDGSVWVDLTGDGLDQKVLLRSDGTSVYMTQDIGTAILRFRDFPKIEGQIYTVGNEQEYHFKVLFLILGKLGYEWAKKCYHLSYGMVDLPTGKMKSREGTVVDADDLMQEMVDAARTQTQELGKIDEMSREEVDDLAEMIGLSALKFFLLKVDPKKRMMFDPNESIQLQGHTGPFIQYTHARIKAILRKASSMNIAADETALKNVTMLEPAEREVIFKINQYITKLQEAVREYSPAVIANYAYELAKEYNQFYQAVPIFNESDPVKLKFRIAFSEVTANTIQKAMALLGIRVPERM
ncbi:MAG TPA: arginine--tRNA ligase [Cyclobacteriaceae bacterium]|jgi:arginyl-tRNA synthetase|nr:arginine--tRNA ligase [Cytophagales bacterium]HMR56716.1 arginine--tRNA ligase [Cyclobacteriaceae bacterium]HNT48940.1 arginine--tRNA ligase [Cyclobacteriaceae bacterium]HRE65840.1 arginine--tRNA ligase [Cyclobacteriaceae bacterium]HRF33684.1 arginine--tRNA ligase [Cyclobacteriaceae bacterium]